MTTLHLIALTCPICAEDFHSQSVIATDGFGGKRTDFHERASGMQPLPYFVHLCTHCGYAGVERDFTDPAPVSDEVRVHVRTRLTPALVDETLSGMLKYEHAAKAATWHGADARYLGALYLRAAWCAVDEGDTEAEVYFRRQAAWRFAEALAGFDGVPESERAVLTYLIGELWRRVGRRDDAATWFARVAREIVDPVAQRWILVAAQQQRAAPKEWFGEDRATQ